MSTLVISAHITSSSYMYHSPVVPLSQYRTIVGNFRGRKFPQIGDFRRENFHGLLTSAARKNSMPQNFAEKNNSYKTVKFAKLFSLESFPLYGILHSTDEDPWMEMFGLQT